MAYRLYYGSNALFDPYTDNIVYDAKLTAKANTSDYLDFTVPYGHDLYDSLAVKAETVKLYWDKDCLYVGTIESIETDIQGNLDITCTGALDWLADSIVRPYSTVEGEQPLTAPSSVDGLFEWYITQHNEHCLDTRKQFSVGENQGALLDDNNYVYRSNESTPTTLDEVQDKIIDELGGYLFVDYEPLTIDLYADVHTTNAQIIDFGVNITDFTSTTDTSDQYTAIRPEGATPESDDDSDEEQRPITIEGLADGGVEGYSDLWKVGDVVYSVSGVARYGYREFAYSNTDCTTEQGLLTSACKKLNAILSPDLSITVKAVDLSLFMEGYTHLKVGEAVRVRSKFHGVDEYLMVQSIELDLQDPSQSTYELGAEYSTLTGQQSTYLKNLNSNINTALDATSALSDETKAAASEAKDAKTQAAEAKAAADAAVVSNVAQWATTADPATKPAEGDWSEEAPDYEVGKYIWLRNVITYGSGDTSTTDGVCITGNTGKGVKGDNAYVHIAYANSEDGKTDFSVDDPVGKSYIGQYSDNEEDDSTDPTKYAWTKIKGEQGKQGEKGDQGEQGIQGEKGDQGIQGEKGAKGDKGDDGTSVTVSSTSTQYASSTSGTDAPSSWQDTIPSVAAGSYLWTKTTVVYSDGNSTSTYTVALQGKTGAKGDKGDTGAAGASKFTWIKYADSPTSGMSDSPDGKAYMGVAYNKDTATESTAYGDYSWSLIKGETGATGAKGDKGDTGATGAAGAKGDTGATGNGIKSMSYAYKATTTQTQPAASEITATTIPTLSATNKYLWQKETVTFTSGSTQTNVALVGTYGDTGAKGDKGETGAKGEQGEQGIQGVQGAKGDTGASVTEVAVTYGLSTSNASDGYSSVTSWTTDIPDWETGKYIWQKSVTTIGTTAQTPVYALYGAFNSLATSVNGNSSKITQTASALGVTFGTSKATGTLINADSTGIEVGYSSDGSSFASTHTKMGTDAFSIHDKSHNELASFGTNTVELGKNSKDTTLKFRKGSFVISSKQLDNATATELTSSAGGMRLYNTPNSANGYSDLQLEQWQNTSSTSVLAGNYTEATLTAVAESTEDTNGKSASINLESFAHTNAKGSSSSSASIYAEYITLYGKFTPPRPKLLWYNQATNVDAYDSMNNSSGTWADFYMFCRCNSNYDASSSAAYGYKVTDLLAHTDYYTLTTKTAGWWLLTFQAGVSNAGTAAADRVGCGIFIGGNETASCFEQAYNDGGSQHHPMARTMAYIKSGTTIKARMYASYYGKMYTHSRFTRFEMEFLGGDSHELGPDW